MDVEKYMKFAGSQFSFLSLKSLSCRGADDLCSGMPGSFEANPVTWRKAAATGSGGLN